MSLRSPEPGERAASRVPLSGFGNVAPGFRETATLSRGAALRPWCAPARDMHVFVTHQKLSPDNDGPATRRGGKDRKNASSAGADNASARGSRLVQ